MPILRISTVASMIWDKVILSAPDRLAAIDQHFERTGIKQDIINVQASVGDNAIIALAHPSQHIDLITNSSPSQGTVYLDGDTAMNPFSHNAAKLAVGAGIQAIEGVIRGDYDQAFCAVRPPGHHAESEQAMGFCFYNSIAIAALHALNNLGLNRVAIIDFDVHHGNGTVEILKDDPRVMICSSFQHPFYPGRYHNIERDFLVNTPLQAGTDSLLFRRSIESQWLKPLEAFAPECILISAGFDAHHLDPLAQLNLIEADYYWVTELLAEQAKRSAKGKIVSMLEGGYHLDALANSSFEHIKALINT